MAPESARALPLLYTKECAALEALRLGFAVLALEPVEVHRKLLLKRARVVRPDAFIVEFTKVHTNKNTAFRHTPGVLAGFRI